MTSKRAYTLIEILIVLALLSLLMAIAFPRFAIFNTIKENQEFRELKRDLLSCRNKAIVENCKYEFRRDISNNSYKITSTSVTPYVKFKKFESSLKFINSYENKGEITFGPSGSPSQSGSFVIQKRNGDKYRFAIAVTSGKINIHSMK